MRFLCVFHQDKVGLPAGPYAVGANPTCSYNGMRNAFRLASQLKELGPFYKTCFCSRLARASDTASALCLALDLDFQSMKGLGQHANKDGDQVISYPGFEDEDFGTWQHDAACALFGLADDLKTDNPVLVVTHGPIIASLIAFARGIHDPDQIEAICEELRSAKLPYVMFDITGGGNLRIVE